MKIGIICAMDEEIRILVENLENAEKHTRHGLVFHSGSIGRHEVVLFFTQVQLAGMKWSLSNLELVK